MNGQAQVVPAFQDSTTWIREELWVETDFDTIVDLLFRRAAVLRREGQIDLINLVGPAEVPQSFAPRRKVEECGCLPYP